MNINHLNTVLILFVFCSLSTQAQKFKKMPEAKLEVSTVEKHIRFLASDELMGRKTGHAGNNSAARYIAEEFRSYGLNPVNGDSYFQSIPFELSYQPKGAKIVGGKEVLNVNEDFLLMNGEGINLTDVAKVHIGYGWISDDGSHNDYKGIDVKGKVVVVQVGTPETQGFRQMMAASVRKEQFAIEHGALAIIEIFTAPIPWSVLTKNFGNGSLNIKDGNASSIPRFLMTVNTAKKIGKEVVDEITITCDALLKEPVFSNNVIGFVEGIDVNLKTEYVLLSAHYDHLGFHEEDSEFEDKIFNGARDNAIGVAGLLSAAQSIAAKPAKRSMLFIAFTGEEIGLRGSNYYAENPLMALNKCIFNLNIDGAGYNDKTKISGIGITRTGAHLEISKAVKAVGLTLIDDPTPELELFDRSDNLRFAAKGIPAPSFSPGFTSFDGEIAKYYHKEADEAESLDFPYCTKFCQSYAYAARLIANKAIAPKWIKGDKYEMKSKELYGN
jgi:hypothetical protein